jgi:hypothetical protein
MKGDIAFEIINIDKATARVFLRKPKEDHTSKKST